jgi:bifunctional DNA-binding transcriptional regulator/antitoxin component of YhaV-PrlF toxin-antitoxin module
MLNSRITKDGRTTIPVAVRNALQIQAGDRLQYSVEGNKATIRVCRRARTLRGSLASSKGEGLSFAQIRKIAAAAKLKRLSVKMRDSGHE